MATTTSLTTTYAGEFAKKYVAAALLSSPTIENGGVEIMPNVKYKQVLQKVATDGILKDATCDFTATSTITLSERVLQVKDLQVNLQLCKEEFVNSWEAISLGYSAFDNIPKSFTDYLISYVGGKVAEATETSIWQGITATNGQFGGFQTILSASVAAGTGVISAKSGSVVISGSVTSGNVLSVLNSIVDTIPNTVYGKEDLLLYVPTNVAKAYQQALAGGAVGANGWNNQLNVGEKPFNFNGIEIVLCPGLGASKVVAAQKSNLFLGTGLLSDYNEVRVLDMANIDGSQNYRIIMRYTAGTQFGIAQDIVYYGAY
jgi:hypothetical protein